MVTMVIEHELADWALWKPVFDEHAAVRKQHGCVREELLRGAGGENRIMNVMRWPDRAAAEAFLTDPSLADAFGRAGVVGEPRVSFWDTVETTEF
jgi:quinol monooxygenase YgiN